MTPMETIKGRIPIASLAITLLSSTWQASAAEPDKDFHTWAAELDAVVAQGEELFRDPFYSENGKSCSECHANAAATRAHSFPKFRPQQGRVIQLWEMVNWCLDKALGKTAIAADDPEMTALIAYMRHAKATDQKPQK